MQLYDNSRTVANEAEILAAFQQRSRLAYQHFPCFQEIRYAEAPRSSLDVFPLAQATTTLVFIHGGYWQWCDKSDFAFIVTDVLAKGMQCVLVEYELAPQSTMAEIVAQVKQALDFIQQQPWITQHVLLVGHSAGAHLAALWMQHEIVTETVLLSGIYDLAPIQQTHLNRALNLTEQDILQYSPLLRQHAISKPYSIYCGEQELDELILQSQNYFQHRSGLDQAQVSFKLLDKTNHYTILDEYFQHLLKPKT